MEEKNWKYLNVTVLVSAGILFLILAVQRNFWYDEAYTVGMIRNSFADIVSITARDVHSPFYYYMLKMFYLFPGMRQMIAVKLFSWIFMMLYLFGGSRVCRKIYGRKVEFYWLIFSCFMPPMIIQATNARMYTMGLFFVTMGYCLAYSIHKEETRQKWICFTIISILAVYTHTFCMLEMVVLYAIFLLAAWKEKEYKRLIKILISGLCVSVCFLPWLITLWHQFNRWIGRESGWSSIIEEVSIYSVKQYLAEWFSSGEDPNKIVILFGIAVMICAGFHVVRYMKKNRDYLPCLGVVAASVVFVAAMIVSIFIAPCFLGRYLFPMAAGIWLFAAVGISRMKYRWERIVIIAGVLLSGFYAYRDEFRLENSDGLEVYESCVKTQLGDTDIIMADNYFLMMMSIYYPEADYMIYGSAPDCLPFDYEIFTRWEQLDGVDTVWYLSFNDFRCGGLDEYYSCDESFNFSFSYYDIQVDKYVRKDL